MASRKEEKERLRKERLEAEKRAQSSQRQRLMVGYVLAGVIGVVVLAGIIFVVLNSSGSDDTGGSANVSTRYGTLDDDMKIDNREGTPPPPVKNGDLQGAANVADCDLQLNLKSAGSTHFSDLNKVVKYATEPPTSGDHYASAENGSGALADGAYLNTPNWNRAVHALEHGRIQIQYSSDLPEEDQLALKGVFDEDRPGVDLFPNDDMPYAVAAAAWTNLVGCKTFEGAKTLDVIRAFRDSFRGQGPEQIPYLPY
ncbi:MAG: DUF3105 domain-containing protein [Solirubrobacterales bacterium]